MSVCQGQVTIASCVSHSPTCPYRQEVATYLTDFMHLSSLVAGLLPGDSFLLRRKASRFFMSLALSGGKIERRGEEKTGNREGGEGVGKHKEGGEGGGKE